MDIVIRSMIAGDSQWLQAGFEAMGWRKPDGYFAGCHEQQHAGRIEMLVAEAGGEYVGHVKLVWSPEYEELRKQGYPEIQDLSVLPAYRRQGVATQLLDRVAVLASSREKVVGIGVGLHPGYNSAQVLYVLRGYDPDGRGVTCYNEYVGEGQHVRMDDELVLHLAKELVPDS